ncbi:MAG: aminotransferase-like domain-containing protein [Candidatus Hodarchaeales archaeon]
MEINFADRIRHLKGSEIREILKFIGKPGIISFAGGLPAPELFPIEEIKEATTAILESDGSESLQYTPSEGFLPLREKISQIMTNYGLKKITPDNILMVNGSQQGLDFSGKLFLNPDDVVICESPTYLGAINAFKVYQCKFIECPSDDEGMNIEALKKILSKTQNVKLLYVTPDFQNPSGKTWSITRRKKLVDVVNHYNIPVIEDNPYRELRYEGDQIPPIKSFDTKGNIIFLGTFSKTICPGLRIAWVCAHEKVLNKYILAKESADLQCNPLSQRQVNYFLEKYDFESHIAKIIKVYKRRRDLMLENMEHKFPSNISYRKSKGGLFIWVELPEHLNTRDLLELAFRENIAFVPGGSFFPNGEHENYFRLCFSNMTESLITEGMNNLAHIVKEFVQ